MFVLTDVVFNRIRIRNKLEARVQWEFSRGGGGKEKEKRGEVGVGIFVSLVGRSE